MEPYYTSCATRCPNGGESDIFFTWDVRSGVMRALPAVRQPEGKDAVLWCGNFNLRGKRFDTLHEACRFVERYDTWFQSA